MVNDKYSICDSPGPCWDGYIYVGPEVGEKGSCVKKSKLCKKSRGKGIQCKEKIKCDLDDAVENKPDKGKPKTNKPKTNTTDKNVMEEYEKCLKIATERFDKGELKLCPRGYCTAKQKFEVYPSAYANGYASSVCKGDKPGFLNQKEADSKYLSQFENTKKDNSLNRWFEEKWVNLCEKGNGPGGFQECGTGKGVKSPEKYPYCRAYYKLPGTEVVTVEELQKYFPDEFQEIISTMCNKKRSLPQGVDGKPTRVNLPKHVYETIQKMRNNTYQNGGLLIKNTIKIPEDVRNDALQGLKLLELGFEGGTSTGWDRAKQLAFNETIDVKSLADMRTWFARHGPDAKNGGTSYPGYCKWVKQGMPLRSEQKSHRGAVSWLIWGGDPAYKWLKTKNVRDLLKTYYPKRKSSPNPNTLNPNCKK